MLDHVLLEPLNTVQIFLFGICLSVCLLKFLALTRCKVALKYANKWEASNYVLVRTLKIWLSVLFVNMITCPLVNLSFFCNFHFFYVPLYGSTFLLNYMKEEKNTSEHNRTDRGRRISNWTTKSITILTKLLLQLLGSEFETWRCNTAWVSMSLFSFLIRKWDVARILSCLMRIKKVWVFYHK